jgi:hypothetical protein
VILNSRLHQLSPEFYKVGGVKPAYNFVLMKSYKFKNKYEKESYIAIRSKFLIKQIPYDIYSRLDLFSNPLFKKNSKARSIRILKFIATVWDTN